MMLVLFVVGVDGAGIGDDADDDGGDGDVGDAGVEDGEQPQLVTATTVGQTFVDCYPSIRIWGMLESSSREEKWQPSVANMWCANGLCGAHIQLADTNVSGSTKSHHMVWRCLHHSSL